jgi:LysM repeat protein
MADSTGKIPFLCNENYPIMQKLCFLFLMIPLFAAAQDKLLVEGVSPGLYLTHKVAPKENYYSIGRIYNVSPKDIAPFNKLQLEKGLSLGQTIKIPLNPSNFYQSGNAANDETFVPVYYKIKEKEGLYRVAKNHHDLPLETLKQWNKITGDAVKNGAQLVVGYLKVKKELSGLSKNGIGSSIGSTAITVKEEKTDPVPEALEVPVNINGAEKRKPKETVKEKIAKEAETKAVVAAETKISKPEKITPAAEPKKTIRESNTNDADFKTLYEGQIKNAEIIETAGKAGVFKSTSGWSDKKYYCLHNSSTQGTIILLTNPVNGNFVYAKVLDAIPDIKKNEGLSIIISNAAADALGASEANFNCLIKYAK